MAAFARPRNPLCRVDCCRPFFGVVPDWVAYMMILPVETTEDAAAARREVAVLPVGSFEQHGPHLPLATDTLVATAIALELADSYGLLRLPPLTFSCSQEHVSFPGTVSIRATTLVAVVEDVWKCLRQSGLSACVIVNGHGGNYVLHNLVQEANVGGPRMVLFPGRQDWEEAREHAGLESCHHDDMHAGELETSILLAVCPELLGPQPTTEDHLESDRRLLGLLGMPALTKSGIVGLPSLASADKGRLLLEGLRHSFERYAAHLPHPDR